LRFIVQLRFELGLMGASESLAEIEALLPKLVEHDGQEGGHVAALHALRAKLES
jgi:hypothetical protein